MNGKSSIYGVVADQNKAVIPGALVTITNTGTGVSVETTTNSDGIFLQTGLASGKYSVKAVGNGFRTMIVNEVVVGPEKLIEVNFVMQVGAVSVSVEVTSGASSVVDVSSSAVSTSNSVQTAELLPKGLNFSSILRVSPTSRTGLRAGEFQIDGASGSENTFIIDGQDVRNVSSGILGGRKTFDLVSERNAISTPRLREYFPETLLWRPELVTDDLGRAELKFTLADNITTWKIYLVASDIRGRLAIARKEIRVFQPFFVDLIRRSF